MRDRYVGFFPFHATLSPAHACAHRGPQTKRSEIRARALLTPPGPGAYHAGDDPDDRTMSTLAKHGIHDYTHAARKVRAADFAEFDYLFAMDRSNLSDLQRQAPKNARAKVLLFGEYAGTGKAEIVQDPYYGGREGFETAYQQCRRFAENFLRERAAAGKNDDE